jgi:ribosomal RNA-processing protein 8
MFAVPGWSVSSSALRTQTADTPKTTSTSTDGTPGQVDVTKPSKKRKRNNGKSKTQSINADNLSELWESVIEGKSTEKPGEKRQKTVKEEAVAKDDQSLESKVEQKKSKKTKAPKEKSQKRDSKNGSQDATNKSSLVTTAAAPATALPSAKLTPLQASMRQKLISARFRHLNETLYTKPSTHSLDLFQHNPEMFQEYHEGFRRQVEVWPENPVDGYVQLIRQRGKNKSHGRGKDRSDEGSTEDNKSIAALPLPRTKDVCHIADLGCGDAALTQTLDKEKKKLKLHIHSFDLQNPSPLVTKADIANLPLEDASVDVAIFCLALMGTNWIDFIEEAFRILRWKGELWVAEIKSRFGRVNNKHKRVEHSVGNRKKPDKKTLKKMEEEADDQDLMVEVDGADDMKQETDVSAFVEVLRKRGFVLQNDKAVDLSNRMFVKMHFVKGVTPIKGKCVPVPKGMAEMGLETWKKKPKAKFIEEDVPVSTEGSVLKPCVYKLR